MTNQEIIKEIKKFGGKEHKGVWIIDPTRYWEMMKNNQINRLSNFGSLNLPKNLSDIIGEVKIVINR